MTRAAVLVSVVTPFYNTEAYLAACIESVLAQTHRHFEYLLVNNCSTDRSAEIAEHYTRKDPRIRLIHNEEFRDQVENYNQALTHIAADSQYCKIVQADDWIFPACLEEMVKVGQNDRTVGLISAYNLQEREVHMQGLPCPSRSVSGREVSRKLLLDGTYLWGSPTTILVRSEIVRARKPFFDPSVPSEDVDVCLDILKKWNFGFVHQVLTFTRRQADSRMAVLLPYGIAHLTRLTTLCRYGREFLSMQEYRARRAHVQHSYYMFIGRSVLRLRGGEFWHMHQQGLRAAGARLNYTRVVLYTAFALAESLLSPLPILKRLGLRCLNAWLARSERNPCKAMPVSQRPGGSRT